MKTDRELLELAAKAAGYKITATSSRDIDHVLVRIDDAPAVSKKRQTGGYAAIDV